MAPKDIVNIDWNYFYYHLIKMDNEHDDDEEINLTNGLHASSIDSLEQYDIIPTPTSESLRFISGYHKWMNTNDKTSVDKINDYHHGNNNQIDFMVTNDDNNSIQQNTLSINDMDIILKNHSENEEEEEEEEEEDNEYSLSHMDISLDHFDVEHQINNDQLQQPIRNESFSSILSNISQTEKMNQNLETLEMDMENGDYNRKRTNEYSQHRNNNNDDESYKRNNHQMNGSSNNNNNGNGTNPNRNNNNSRRSDDGSEGNDGDDDNDDNDDDDNNNNDYDDNESDENIARRLGFLPINNETIRIINRLRNLTNKQTFDRRDFEILQTLIDELIHIQHLENSSKQQLKQIIRYLKLYRPLQTKSRALIFIQERIPRRAVKYNVISINNENHHNVFDIWRERERRARLDSKDSLEDDGQNSTGQQLRDVIEINHPTPPIILSTNSNINSNVTSKVKQMARNIDTRSTTSRSELNIRTGDRFSDHAYIQRSSSPSYPGLVSVALYDIKSTNKNDGSYNGNFIEDRSRTKPLINQTNSLSPTSSSEPNRVRLLIDRLESSSTSSSSNIKTGKKISVKKSLHDEHSDGSTSLTSSPPVKRFARRDYNEKNLINENNHNNEENFVFVQDDTHDGIFFSTNNNKNISNEIKFEIDREDTANEDRRTISVTSMEEYVTTLLPGTETSVSMVRDIRAHVYEDVNALSRTDLDTIPIKVDVETLYILEEKSDKKPFQPPTVNIHIPDYEYNRPTTTTERQDFAVQTTIPIPTIKPSYRPVGTQVESIIQQHTVAAQTTDSLHRPLKERQRLPSRTPSQEDDTKKLTTTITTKRYEIKRRHSSHHTSDDDDNDDGGAAVIFIDDESKLSNYEDNFELKREKRHSAIDDHLPKPPEQRSSFGQITSRIRIDQLRDINRHVVRRHLQDNDYNQDEYHSSEVYEIHTRGACKCIVVSYEEKTQYGIETRFEKQLQRIERTYTNDELKKIELHIIVTTSDKNYQLVKRDYNLIKQNNIIEKENNYEKSKQPSISIHYYTKDGQHMKTEHDRYLEHLPLVIRCEIEYELNHYGNAQLIILSVTHNERRQMNKFLKEELVNEIVSRSGGRLPTNSPQLEKEITRQLAEPINLLHLVDYSSRDDYNQTNSTDLRRVSRIDVTTSLRIVQRYRTIIHRFCQLYRTNLHLTQQIQQQRYLILVAHNEYYLLDLSSPTSTITTNVSDIRQRQHDIFKREVNSVIQQQQKQQQHQPFDYAKYRRDIEQQKRFLEQHQRKQNEQKEKYQQTSKDPPPPGHPSEAEFYLGSERRALIEREIHSMRESIRPHEHAPPRYKYEPTRRSSSIGYSGGQRYIRARIIHIKDFYDDIQQRQQQQQQPKTKEQELFVRIDDYINESVANSLRRSYSTDYLQEDGPRSRIRYIRIPGETIKIEEKTTYEYKGVMYADLPYSLRYWNILYILDREARQGRPVGSTLPHTIVNDPYRQVIPPLTQHEIRQTAQQILSPQYNGKSYTDQTLRWFLSRDNRTEIESAKYLQTLDQYRAQQQQQHKKSNVSLHSNEQQGTTNTYYTTEKLIRYEKMPDRLIPITTHDRAQSMQNFHHRSPSTPHILKPPNLPQNYIPRSQSQSQSHYQSSIFSHGSNCQTPSQQQQQRIQLQSMHSPLSRHQSVHELHASSAFSHPPSPSPSFHSLHSNQHHYINRRPLSYNTRFPLPQQQQQQQQNAVLTEIIDSQTGRHFLTTSQEQLPTEVLGLLNKYNLQKF